MLSLHRSKNAKARQTSVEDRLEMFVALIILVSLRPSADFSVGTRDIQIDDIIHDSFDSRLVQLFQLFYDKKTKFKTNFVAAFTDKNNRRPRKEPIPNHQIAPVQTKRIDWNYSPISERWFEETNNLLFSLRQLFNSSAAVKMLK